MRQQVVLNQRPASGGRHFNLEETMASTANWYAEIRELQSVIREYQRRIKSLRASIAAIEDKEEQK